MGFPGSRVFPSVNHSVESISASSSQRWPAWWSQLAVQVHCAIRSHRLSTIGNCTSETQGQTERFLILSEAPLTCVRDRPPPRLLHCLHAHGRLRCRCLIRLLSRLFPALDPCGQTELC